MENIDSTYLAKLQDYYAETGVLPPYSTIMGIVGMKSKSPVAALVARLKLQGYLESTPEKRLKPGRRFFERPIFDSVRAGFPSPAGDTQHDTLTIDEFLVSHPSSTVLVNVKGDSVLIRLSQTPTRCSVTRFCGVKLGIGRGGDIARDAEQ